MSDECDPILVADDDGEVLDATDDGAVVCVEESDGLSVHVDPDSELGELLTWYAGHCGENPDDVLADAIREQLDSERATLDEFGIVRTNDGDESA